VSSICVGLQGVTTKFVGVAPIITFKDATKKSDDSVDNKTRL